MSMICENTYIVENEKLERFLKTLEDNRDLIRINGIKQVFTDSKYTVVLFDSNGEPNNYDGFDNDSYYIGETSYLDGEAPYTYGQEPGLPIEVMICQKKLFPDLTEIQRQTLLSNISYSVESGVIVNA